jgi:hypothetical protein
MVKILQRPVLLPGDALGDGLATTETATTASAPTDNILRLLHHRSFAIFKLAVESS